MMRSRVSACVRWVDGCKVVELRRVQKHDNRMCEWLPGLCMCVVYLYLLDLVHSVFDAFGVVETNISKRLGCVG